MGQVLREAWLKAALLKSQGDEIGERDMRQVQVLEYNKGTSRCLFSDGFNTVGGTLSPEAFEESCVDPDPKLIRGCLISCGEARFRLKDDSSGFALDISRFDYVGGNSTPHKSPSDIHSCPEASLRQVKKMMEEYAEEYCMGFISATQQEKLDNMPVEGDAAEEEGQRAQQTQGDRGPETQPGDGRELSQRSFGAGDFEVAEDLNMEDEEDEDAGGPSHKGMGGFAQNSESQDDQRGSGRLRDAEDSQMTQMESQSQFNMSMTLDGESQMPVADGPSTQYFAETQTQSARGEDEEEEEEEDEEEAGRDRADDFGPQTQVDMTQVDLAQRDPASLMTDTESESPESQVEMAQREPASVKDTESETLDDGSPTKLQGDGGPGSSNGAAGSSTGKLAPKGGWWASVAGAWAGKAGGGSAVKHTPGGKDGASEGVKGTPPTIHRSSQSQSQEDEADGRGASSSTSAERGTAHKKGKAPAAERSSLQRGGKSSLGDEGRTSSSASKQHLPATPSPGQRLEFLKSAADASPSVVEETPERGSPSKGAGKAAAGNGVMREQDGACPGGEGGGTAGGAEVEDMSDYIEKLERTTRLIQLEQERYSPEDQLRRSLGRLQNLDMADLRTRTKEARIQPSDPAAEFSRYKAVTAERLSGRKRGLEDD